MIVFFEGDGVAVAWLRYYNKGGWVYSGPKVLGNNLKNGASPTIGEADEKILLTDSKERLEHDLPLIYESPYLWCSVLSDDFDPNAEPPVPAGDFPNQQHGSVPAVQTARQPVTENPFNIVLSDDVPMANDYFADTGKVLRTPDDVVAVLGFDPDNPDVTDENNPKLQHDTISDEEAQLARKPRAQRKK